MGGSLSAYIAERLNWRVSFWILGAAGILFTVPLSRFFPHGIPRLSGNIGAGKGADRRLLSACFAFLRCGSCRLFVAVATFGLFLVWSWLPTFLYDKFHLGLARAGSRPVSIRPLGTALGLLWAAASRIGVMAARTHPDSG